MASALASQMGVLAAARREGDNAAPAALAGGAVAAAPVGKASLLYSAREAADVDLTTIYSIGAAGFQQLCRTDSRFEAFGKSLFNSAGMGVERSTLPQEAVAKLNANIAAFMRLIAPHFLLPPAAKALEFLIRRYRIHQHNVEAIMLCALPYHSTHDFVRLVQLCWLEPGSTWEFLGGMKSTGAPLPRPALVSRVLKDRRLLEFVVSMGKDRLASGRVVTFQAVVLCEALGLMPRVEEDAVVLLAPHLLAGMENGATPNHQAAAYMVTAALAPRASLSAAFLAAIVERAARVSSPAQLPHALMLMAVLARTQKELNTFPDKALKHTVKQPELSLQLSALVSRVGTGVAAPLLRLLVDGLAEKAVESAPCARALDGLLRHLPTDAVQCLAPSLSKQLLAHARQLSEDEEVDGAGAAPLREVLRALDAAAPDALDAALNKQLARSAKAAAKAAKAAGGPAQSVPQESSRQRFVTYLQDVLHGSVRAPLTGTDTSLAVAVNSTVPAVRATALAALDKAASADDAKVDTVAFAQAMALRSLGDESGEVVRTALGMDCLAAAPPEAAYGAAAAAFHTAMAQVAGGGESDEATSSARGSAKKLLRWLAGSFLEANTAPRWRAAVDCHIAEAVLGLPASAALSATAIKLARKSGNPFLKGLKSVDLHKDAETDTQKPKGKKKKKKGDEGATAAGAVGGSPSNADLVEALAAHCVDEPSEAIRAAEALATSAETHARALHLVLAALGRSCALRAGTPEAAAPAAAVLRIFVAQPVVSPTSLGASENGSGSAEGGEWSAEAEAALWPSEDGSVQVHEAGLTHLSTRPCAAAAAAMRASLHQALHALNADIWKSIEAKRKSAGSTSVLSATLSALASTGGFRPSVSSLCQELVAVAVPASEVVQWATAVIAATPGSDKAAPTTVSSQVTVLEVLRCELVAEHNAGRLKEMRLANLLPGLLTAAASPHKVVRQQAGTVLAAISALADSEGEDVLGVRGSARSSSASLPVSTAAAVVRLLGGETASIARDAVTVVNSVRAAFRAAGYSAADRHSGGKKGVEGGGPLGAEGGAKLGAFLLHRLSSCCADPSAANAEATTGHVLLACLRDWGDEGELLSAAASCLANIIAGSRECPEGGAVLQAGLGVELLRQYSRPSALSSAPGGPTPLLQGLLTSLRPGSTPPLFAPMRAAALRCVTRDLYAAAKKAEAEVAGALVVELMRQAARDADLECQRSAHAALTDLPLGADDLLPLLQSSGGRKRARRGASPAVSAAAEESGDGGSEERTVFVLELLQWKRVEGGGALLPRLAALLSAKIDAAEKRGDAPQEGEGEGRRGVKAQSKSAAEKEYAKVLGLDEGGEEEEEEEEEEGEKGVVGGSSAADASYVHQLLLSSIAELVAAGGGEGAEAVDVGAVVRAVRLTEDPAERSAALRLLSCLAEAAPEGTLQHVLEVINAAKSAARFDAETWEAGAATLAAVVPAWLRSGRELSELLSSAVSVLPDLTPTRRAPLLQAMLKALPAEHATSGLAALLLLLLQELVRARQAGRAEDVEMDEPGAAFAEVEWLADLAAGVASTPPVGDRLRAFAALLDHLRSGLPGGSRPSRSTQRLVATFVTEQLGRIKSAESAAAQAVDGAPFRLVLQAALKQMQALGAALKDMSGKKRAAQTALIDSLCSCVAALEGLVDAPAYVGVLVTLATADEGGETATRCLRLLAEKVAGVAEEAEEEAAEGGGPACDALPLAAEAALRLCSDDIGSAFLAKGSSAPLAAQQAYVLAVGEMATAFGASHPAPLLAVAPRLIAVLTAPQSALRGSALLALGRTGRGLGVQLVPLLPKLLPALSAALAHAVSALQQPEDSDSEEEGGVKMGSPSEEATVEAAAVIATLGSLLEGPLAAFLGAHIATVLPHLLSPAVLAARRPGGGAVGLAEQSAELRAMAAESIPARTLLPALVAQLPAAVDAGDASVAALLETVGVAVEAMDGAGVGQHSAAVFDFLLDCMDVRRKRHDHIAEQDRLDSATLRLLVALVMKLSEARFKPLFLRFLEWANASPPDGGRLSRAVLLFAGAEALAARLRSVFVPYFTYLVDAALLHLSPAAAGKPGSEGKAAKKKRRKEGRAKEAESAADGSGMSEEDEVEAWVLRLKVISALSLCFQHDSVGFLEPERFERLLPAIASQLDSAPEGAAATAVDSAASAAGRVPGPEGAAASPIGVFGWALVECLSNMAVASGTDDHWRPLHHAVLMTTRSDSVRTKLTALEVVSSLVGRLAEEYLVLLPEAIPFLAELMEDTSHAVEARTQELVAQLEAIAGESLDPYMKA